MDGQGYVCLIGGCLAGREEKPYFSGKATSVGNFLARKLGLIAGA